MEFNGKVVLITGAGSGIGRTAAMAFSSKGAKVLVSDINEKGGQETVASITDAGGDAHFIKTDVSDYNQVKELIEKTIVQYGRIDVAVNNAGIGGLPSKTADTTKTTYDKVMEVNASGVFFCMKYELQEMMKQGGGAIINTSSIAGLRGLPNQLPYVASKHAVIGMTRTAAMEYGRYNIRVNAICPAFTLTPLFQPEVMDQISEGLSDKLKAGIPMKRFGSPKEIVDGILWLASDQSSFVTGLALQLDGGLTA